MNSPLRTFEQFRSNENERLTALQDILDTDLAMTEDHNAVNGLLYAIGRRHLMITEPLPPADTTMDIVNTGDNFGSKFQMYTDVVPHPEYDFINVPVSVTEDEIKAVLNGDSTAEELDLQGTHLTTPAYQRMAAIRPSFAIGLALQASDPAELSRVDRLRPEFFVALSLMSRLVDAADDGEHYGVIE